MENSGVKKGLIIALCAILAAALLGLLFWNRQTQAKQTAELKEKSKQEVEKEKQEEEGTRSLPTDETVTDSAEQEPTEEAASEDENAAGNAEDAAAAESEAEEQGLKGISIRGDSFLEEGGNIALGYSAKLQAILNNNGFENITVEDNTWDMAGTLSQMSLAGVDGTQVQNYINVNAEKGLTDSNNGSVRDDLETRMRERDDQEYLPVILMGYYGGWGNDVNELVQQYQEILNTYSLQNDQYIILGYYPSGWYDYTGYDQAMSAAFGDHFVNLSTRIPYMMMSEEGRQQTAQEIYDTMLELGYLNPAE